MDYHAIVPHLSCISEAHPVLAHWTIQQWQAKDTEIETIIWERLLRVTTEFKMFRVTPVPESSKERKVSFSPDADESYRHQVVDKISKLMDEVSVRMTTTAKMLYVQPDTVWHNSWWNNNFYKAIC